MPSKSAPKSFLNPNPKVKQLLERYNKTGKLSLILSIIYIVACYLSFLGLENSVAELNWFIIALYILFTFIVIPISGILGLFGMILACSRVKAKKADSMTYAALIIYGISACFVIFEVLG